MTVVILCAQLMRDLLAIAKFFISYMRHCSNVVYGLHKKLSCRRKTARYFVSLNISLSGLRSFKSTPSSTAYCIAIMSVSRTVS